MADVNKQLAQSRPSGTTAASLYSPPASTEAVGLRLFVCNTTSSDANCDVTQDDDGSVATEATALYWNRTIPANSTDVLSCGAMNDSTGNLSVKTYTGNALTFTLHGTERS